nr:metallophosphoesterase [Kofleriaceae bacterium]
MRTSLAISLLLVAACGGGGVGGGGGGGIDAGSGSGSGSGSASSLVFAVVGDTRPPSIDDTANYPSPIIDKIYQDIESATPHPQFAISTGDYQYASTTGSEQAAQLAKYMSARSAFDGPLYPAMGNHECTGYTDSNCGTGNPDGTTTNMTAFLSMMVSPIGETEPYYAKSIDGGAWTAKIVVVACNAWTTAQNTWLGQQLAMPTTYTFVVRHESAADMSDTKCSQSQTTIDDYPLTLLVVGHTHEYRHVSSAKEIINGIGGAPLTSGTNYGYTIVTRNDDGTLTVATYDYETHKTIDSFTVKADGTAG